MEALRPAGRSVEIGGVEVGVQNCVSNAPPRSLSAPLGLSSPSGTHRATAAGKDARSGDGELDRCSPLSPVAVPDSPRHQSRRPVSQARCRSTPTRAIPSANAPAKQMANWGPGIEWPVNQPETVCPFGQTTSSSRRSPIGIAASPRSSRDRPRAPARVAGHDLAKLYGSHQGRSRGDEVEVVADAQRLLRDCRRSQCDSKSHPSAQALSCRPAGSSRARRTTGHPLT